MFKRDLLEKLVYFSTKLPVIALLGPRQSGKTTLAKIAFPTYRYISFEDIDQRIFAQTDPRRFLRDIKNPSGVILDEIQHVPDLVSYIQTYVDEHKQNGYFILTGSQNFLVTQSISQSLAGRSAILTLLPLSLHELQKNTLLKQEADIALFYGGYPRIFEQNIQPNEWYPSYIINYLERDVRQIANVTDLSTFQRFIKLCAGRIGQILNISSLATDCGISPHTAKAWLSVLEASYIVFLLHPYFKNFSKRLIKSPKLYFYDTGIACNLLEIKSIESLSLHYLRGGLFESMIISDVLKNFYNRGERPSIYFWRDSHGHEVDCIIDYGTYLTPIEIKSGETIDMNFFKGLEYWHEIAGTSLEDGYIIYGGNQTQQRSKGNILPWTKTFTLIDKNTA